MLAVTAAGLLAFPLLAIVAIVGDLVRGRLRLPTLRVYLFALQYLINDSVEIVLAPILWIAAGFGRRLTSAGSIARHERLQWWSLEMLQRRADRLLGLRIEIDEESEVALAAVSGGTPQDSVIVLSRHVSLFDASLPSLVLQQDGRHVRGVVMAEMLADPGFDLIYGRLGSVFIPRDDGPSAIAQVRQMTSGAPHGTAFVIFPEGRLFSESVRDRGLARLVEKDPDRGARLAPLRNLLAPRPGGVLALLDALPEADVVVFDHSGLEEFAGVADLLDAVPVREPVRIYARRIARASIPTEPAALIGWLDDTWLDLDRLISARGERASGH